MNNFKKRLEITSPVLVSLVARVDELRGEWTGGATLNPIVLDRLQKTSLITSSGASTRIEGSKLSDPEVEKIMKSLTVTRMAERDVQEVRGYYETLNFVYDNYANLPLTENTILYLHTQLLQYSDKDAYHGGKYKHQENQVEMQDETGKLIEILFETTPAFLTPKVMNELIQNTNDSLGGKTQHRLLVIANFVVEFLKIHPFIDGNGRLSRILTNMLLLQAGYTYIPYISLERLIETSKSDYYIALRRSQATFGTNSESITDWALYFLEILEQQALQATSLLKRSNLEPDLSPAQQKVWEVFLSNEVVSPKAIISLTGVPRGTLAQAVEKLLQLKMIERIGLGRSTRYRKL
jgi:Fic family protein